MKLLGFTGTQNGMSRAQKERVRQWLARMKPDRVMHGGCRGSDYDFHQLVMVHRDLAKRDVQIDVSPSDLPATYPPAIKKLCEKHASNHEKVPVMLAWLDLGATTACLPQRPLVRNRQMVDELHEPDIEPETSKACLLATVSSNKGEAFRSGTWATVNYARKQHVPIVIIRPNGTYTRENWGVFGTPSFGNMRLPRDYFAEAASR